MKHRIKQLMVVPLITAAISTSAFAETAPPSPRTITFVELNDLHANLVGHKDLVRNPDGTTAVGIRGGMARMKTVIDRLRAKNKDTLVMNIGDTFHGGVEAFYSLGNAVADPLNAMGIDIGVPGNWDFYFTPVVTRARYGRSDAEIVHVNFSGFADPFPVKRPNFPNLGANVRDITDVLPRDFLPPTHIFEMDGIKVGFIGFTSDIVEVMQPMLAEGMDFAWGKDEHLQLLIKYARSLRDKGADIVAVMSELGLHKDVALSKALAEMAAANTLPAGLIDVFFSAHTHEATHTPITKTADGTVLYAPVVEAGNDGYLGQMDVTMQYEGSTTTGLIRKVTEQHWSAKSMQWNLITIDESIPEDPQLKQIIQEVRAPFLSDTVNLTAVPFIRQHLTQPIDTVIGHVKSGAILRQDTAMASVLSRNDSLNSTFNTALTNMLHDLTGTDIAITPGFRMGATIPEAGYMMENKVVADGDITLEDAYRFFPMYYAIATGTTTGAHLKEVIEGILSTTYSADTWNNRGGWNYGYAGLDVAVDLAAGDTRRISSLTRSSDGSVIQDGDILTVTGCRRMPVDFDGVLCGIGGFNNIQQVLDPRTGDIWSLVDVFTYLLQDQGYPLKADGSHFTDSSKTLRWPVGEFIQPLEGVGEYFVPHDPNDPCGFFKWNCMNNS